MLVDFAGRGTRKRKPKTIKDATDQRPQWGGAAKKPRKK